MKKQKEYQEKSRWINGNKKYTRLSKFKKMNAALSNADWKEAAKEGRDSLWYRQVTNRAERLMSRLENIS
jgi:hypothetical protein